MSWRDRLVKASLRGFEFKTEQHDEKGGRRLIVTEYPGSDIPSVRDHGLKAWDWKLNAYFVGTDYDLECNGFLAKLAEPGPTWLRHPWLGLLWVLPHTWQRSETNAEGGYATVSIEFVPGGEIPQPTQDKVDAAISYTRKLSDAAVEDYSPKPMSADGMTAFIAAVQGKLDVLRNVISLASLPLTWASQIRGVIAGLKGDLAALMALPDAYANALRGLADDLGAGADESGLDDTERPRVVARIVSTASSGTSVSLSGVAATDSAVRYNLAQDATLNSRLLVASAAQIALADYQAAADRDAVLASVVVAMDALLVGASDPVFEAVVAAQTALIDALMSQDLASGVVRDVAAPIPAAVLAYQMGITEGEFLARNGVTHPLFVAGTVYG